MFIVSLKKASLVAVSLAGLCLATACGSDKKDDAAAATPAPASTTWTNAGMQTLVTTTCAKSKCHDGTTAPNYKGITEANMKKDLSARTAVDGKTMPTDTPYTAAQISTFDAFYK